MVEGGEVWHIPAYGYRDGKHPFCGATGKAYDYLAYACPATCPACLMKVLAGENPNAKTRVRYNGETWPLEA